MKMTKDIVSILGLTLSILILVFQGTNAWVVHSLQKRSLDGQPELEHSEGAASETKLEDQSFARPSPVNSFHYVLPFWWHYLRPMLNIFATNNDFRQTLQKEYEYEIEHGSLNEIEVQEAETPSSFEQEGSEFEFAGNEVEIGEREQSHVNSFSTEVLNEENGIPDVEHMMESNSFSSLDSEHESNVQEQAELPELESITENTQLNDDMGITEEVGNIGDFGIERENQDWEKPEQENRRFFLTGNIVGSFSNSLMNLMPGPLEEEIPEHDKRTSEIDAFANDEVDMSHPSRWEQSADGTLEMNGDMPNSENENFALQTPFNTNSLINNNFGNQNMQGEDIGDRSPRSFGFQNNDIGDI